MRDTRSKSGSKTTTIGQSVNDTLENLNLAASLDCQIIDIVKTKGKSNPKLYEKIVGHRLIHGKQPDPHDQFAHMSTEQFFQEIFKPTAINIHPRFQDPELINVKEHMLEVNLWHKCSNYNEGQLKKKSTIGESPDVN